MSEPIGLPDCTMVLFFLNVIRRLRSKLHHHALRQAGVEMGEGTWISPDAQVEIIGGGRIVLGKRCQVHAGAKLLTYGGLIVLGDDVSLNPYTIAYGHGGLKIGNGVRIAAHTVLIPSNHNFQDKNKPIFQQGETSKGIVVEDDVWMGAGVRVLDGVKVAKGTVVAAGAVLTKNTEAFGVYAGVPARKISERS